jgi:Zn-dependent protease
VPFLGAVVWARQLGGDAAAEARVGLAGPVIGSLGALALLIPYALTGDDFWRALAYTGIFLNLFNLVPVTPLDGGRAFAALTPWMWFVGLFVVVVLVFTFHSPILILIALVAALDTHSRWKARNEPGGREYYRVTRGQRIAIALTYLVLVVGLAAAGHYTYIERDL